MVLLLAGLNLHAVQINGIEVTATSSNPSILPSENIELGASGNALIVNVTTLPDQGGEVEITFFATANGETTVLQPAWMDLPMLRIEAQLGYVLVHWEGTGVLQERAAFGSGTWATVSTDSSLPFVANWDPQAGMKFYRVVR